MKHSRLIYFVTGLALAAGIATAEDAPKTKKFLTKPLVIEDQGSFFIGGVPKVTHYASAPAPGAPNAGAESGPRRISSRSGRCIARAVSRFR